MSIADMMNIIKMAFFNMARQPLVGQGVLIHEVSSSHITTHHNRRSPVDE